MKKLLNLAITCLLSVGASIHAEVELLKTNDVNRIMQQIFSQHVDKKEMSTTILRHAFKVYIDQFDPERIYLLNAEVQPYLEMDASTLNKVMSGYAQNKFEFFQRLDGVIETAILRARKMRDQIEQDKSPLFDSPAQRNNERDEWADPDLKLAFSDSLAELKARMTKHLVRFIDAEKRRYGNEKVAGYQKETLQIYNNHLQAFENQYLYRGEDGKPLAVAQRENLFAFHVLKALASSLDAHTTILNPAEAYDMRVRLEKGFQGIGVGFKQGADGSLAVTSVIEGSPAALNGLIKIGDRLVEVNGVNVGKMPIDKVMVMLRGAADSSVKLAFKRVDPKGAADKTFTVELKRAEIAVSEDRVETTFEAIENGIIGKITLHSFYQGTNGVSSENDVQKAIQELSKQGPLKGLILDLRENSGGFLMQAVKVAGLFITNGVVVVSKYSSGEEHFYRDMNNKISYSGPLIILTSKATASAAEIVAQALQDYGVALVVGDEHTYGKGTIQSQTVTNDKSTSYFKVTVGKYYTVSGKTPQMQGVKADIVIPSPFLDQHMGEEFLDYPLNADAISNSYDDKLADVDPAMKEWFLHYYTPTLQPQSGKWRNMLGVLRSNVSKRLNSNDLYKQFVASENSNSSSADKIRKRYWSEDVQMQEAVNIIKDMVSMQAAGRGAAADTADGAMDPAITGRLLR